MPEATDAPFRWVIAVVAGLALLFLAAAAAVQVGGDPAGVLTLPLLFVVPLALVALYLLFRVR